MNTTNLRTAQLYHLYGNGFLVYANALARANHFVISYAAAVAHFTLGPAPLGLGSAASEARSAEPSIPTDASLAAPADTTVSAEPSFAESAAPFADTEELDMVEGEPAHQSLVAEPSELAVEPAPPLAPADEVPRKASASSSKREGPRNRRRKK